MRFKKKFNSKIISGILAASMVLSSIPAVAFADTEMPENDSDIIIEYTVPETEETSETTVIDETSETVEESDDNVSSIPDDEEVSDDEFAEDIIEPPIDETVATEETVEIIETTETVEDVAEETEVIEDTTVDIIGVLNADEFISAVANLANDNRIVVNTNEDITDSIENANGVYFDGTYVISFSDNASLEFAIDYFDNANITYAIEGTVSLCDTGAVTVSNAEINPDATTRVAVIDTGSNVANEAYSVISDSTSDDNGHGTRMVNYILDNTNDAYIISIKAIGSDGTGSVSDLCSAIEFAMDSDVDIIVMALSVRNNGEYEALEDLISEANGRGITIIASAGNSNSEASNYLPAGCSGVITVGAVTSEGFKYSSSNFGSCVNYYVEATSTSEACATFAGLYIAGNITDVRTDYVPYIIDESEPVEIVENEEEHVIVDGQGEWNFWQISNGITEADIRGAGYGSSDAFRAAITTSASHMNGANYSQSGGNGVSGEKVDCITYVNVAYAEALGVISNVHQTNGYVYFSGSASGSPYGLYTTTGATGCQYWLGNHGITGNGVSINTPLHVEQGDLVFFGTYTEETETTYTCTLKYQAGSAGSSGITYGSERTVTGTGSTQTAAYNNAKSKMTGGGTGGYKINSTTYSSTTSVVSTSMNWGHAAIYSGSGTDFWQARGSAYTAGCSSRSVSINADSTGYNRWLVIHLPTFRPTGHISLEKIVAPGYEDVVSGNPCYNLAGTVYTLYSDAACTNALKTFTFDSNGHCSTQFDISGFNTTYYLKETTAGAGYLLDPTVYKLTIGASIDVAMTVTNMSTNQSYSVSANNEVYKVTVSDVPGLDPLSILLEKDNGTFNTTAPLTGARFRLDYYQTTGTVSGNPLVSYEFALSDLPNYTVNADGSISGKVTLSFLAGLTPTSGENYLKTVNDAMVAMGLSTRDFPIGTYRITEIAAPTGYTLNNLTNQFVIHTNNNHTDVEVTESTLGFADYRGTVSHTLVDNNLRVTFHETPEAGYASLKKTLNVNEVLTGRYSFTCYNTTDGTLIARGTTLADGTVSWVYVAANYRSVEVNANGTYKVLTGTTTTELELPVYNANHEKIVYEFRETIPTSHDYEGTGVNYTYDCPEGWTMGNGYFFKTFTVNAATPSAKNTKIVQCPNRLMYGSLVILKTISDSEGLTEAQTFTFNIYSVDANGNTTLFKENVSVTVPAGQTSGTSEVITQVPLGTYRVVENPNSRYVVTYTTQEVTVTDYTVHPDPFEFSVNNQLKRYDINFVKYTVLPDGTRIAGSVGDANLSGAVYRIYRDANNNGKYDNGEWYREYETDENGCFSTTGGTFITDYTYRVYEVTAPTGYKLSDEVYTFSHAGSSQTTAYKIYDEGGFVYNPETNAEDSLGTLGETPETGRVQIIKFYNTEDDSTMEPEEGAVFEVYLTSAGTYENAREWERDIIITGPDGIATTKDLPWGNYTVHQISSQHDETNNYIADFKVDVKKDGEVYKYFKINTLIELYLNVVKVDSSTGEIIPYAGAGFELYRVYSNGRRVQVTENYDGILRDTFYTDEDGKIQFMYPLTVGHYELVEVVAPEGYVLSTEALSFDVTVDEVDGHIEVGNNTNIKDYGLVIVEFPNDNQMFTITVDKTGEVFASVTDNHDGSYTPVWEMGHLEGATFEIYAAADIRTPDGTLRYSEGDLVDTITTGEDGKATSIELYLGTYRVVEVEAPIGYALSNYDVTVTGTYQGQEISLFDVSAPACYDDHFIPSLDVHKELLPGTVGGSDETMDCHNYTMVTFGIYANEEIVAADGTVIPKDGLIEIIRCDENGVATSTSNYPFGSYYVVELSTDAWHYMDETAYGFKFESPESRTETDRVVHLGLTNVVTNTPETPSIGTTFTYNNSHVAPMNSTVTLVDTVEYEGLKPHTRYEMEGYIVVVNPDGSTSLFNDGEVVGVSFVTDSANCADGTVSGSVNIEFTINTTNLAGKNLVAFESLYHEGARVAIHMDINSESQTIHVPNIHTTATVNGGKVFDATADIVLADVISFENLEVGREYYVSGILMDKSTNQPLGVGECCADVIATTTFIPTESSGTVTVEFRFNGSALLGGQELVVFEEIYDVETNTKVAEHKDINDQGQTVKVKTPPPSTTPTPTPPPITSTGEKLGMTFFAGTILLIVGALGVTILVLRKRVVLDDENSDEA